MYRVQITAEISDVADLELRRLGRLARWVLGEEGVASCELGVVLTDDEEIRALNRRYLERDRPTDVLAFALGEEPDEEGDFVVPERWPPYLGDVVISLDRAREQAGAYGHHWSREVELLLIHGLLHLVGYEDETEEARRRMMARQERLWAAFDHRRSLLVSFGAAFSGLGNLIRTQRNARLHLLATLLVLLVGVWLGLARWEWVVLLLTVALVLVAEALNTAIEALVDLASPEVRSLARRSKDVAAAAVLLAAIFSLVIGLLLFWPYLEEMLP